MANDPVGSVRQDPDTKAVAVRVNDGLPGPWMVATVDRGGHFAADDEVAEWDALAGPPKTTRKAKGES